MKRRREPPGLSSPAQGQRQRLEGSLLMELVIAVSILAIGILGFFASFYSNFRLGETIDQRDEVRLALEDVSEMLRSAPFDTLYATYNGASFPYSTLEGPDGPATVTVTCYVNETSLPAEFGPVADIDANKYQYSSNCSSTYKLLPVRLSVSYLSDGNVETSELYMLIGSGG